MVEGTHLVAIALSLVAAVTTAGTSLFVRVGTERGNALHAVLVVMVVNVLLLTPLVAIVYYPDYRLTNMSWLSFIAAGILGTLLGRVSMYTSIDTIGASRTAPIVASWAVIATILGVVVLGETVTPVHAVAILTIVVGVATIAWETSHENPDDLPRRELLISLLIPFGAVLAYGWEPIFANFGFAEGTPAPVGLVVKTIAATLGFAGYLHWRHGLTGSTLFRSADLRWFVLAGVANTVFLLSYYVALAVAPVNVVVPIVITNPLFVVLLAAVFMPERLERVTWQLAVAAGVVVLGVVIITVSG